MTSLLEYTAIGIETTIIGMGVVFIVLIVLSIIIGALDKFVDTTFGKKKLHLK